MFLASARADPLKGRSERKGIQDPYALRLKLKRRLTDTGVNWNQSRSLQLSRLAGMHRKGCADKTAVNRMTAWTVAGEEEYAMRASAFALACQRSTLS
ncbi:unnamed protein product [Boreogadus saida]